MEFKTPFKFGTLIQDTMSGFYGLFAGYSVFPGGDPQILIQPRVDKDGDYRQSRWFEQWRIAEYPKEEERSCMEP